MDSTKLLNHGIWQALPLSPRQLQALASLVAESPLDLLLPISTCYSPPILTTLGVSFYP